MWCWIRVRSHFSVSEEKVVCDRNGMVKGLLVLGVVRLRKLRAECMRWSTRDRSGSSRLAAMRRKA